MVGRGKSPHYRRDLNFLSPRDYTGWSDVTAGIKSGR